MMLGRVVDEAVETNCNLIICFHPIIFSGLKSLTGRNYVERSVIKALENKLPSMLFIQLWIMTCLESITGYVKN
jgi:putative NIF3 family GTP cyclohydrolase 1 type 2